jgi:nitrate/TMAO reductase-like tetraheme cytochrome c subunit
MSIKRIIPAFIVLLAMVLFAVAGCAKSEPAGVVLEDGTVVSSCVSCHTDKDLLKEVATVEEAATSEETTGEG